MAHHDSRKRLWQIIFSVSVPSASILASLLLIEVILRLCGYYPPLRMEWILPIPSAQVPNRDLILIPPALLQASFYTTNPARRTIVAIGDSFTEGYPVAAGDSYPAVLQRILARHVRLQLAGRDPLDQLVADLRVARRFTSRHRAV